jgi:hypothetical protein
MAESFFATLKTEFYNRRVWPTKISTSRGVGAWIEDPLQPPTQPPNPVWSKASSSGVAKSGSTRCQVASAASDPDLSCSSKTPPNLAPASSSSSRLRHQPMFTKRSETHHAQKLLKETAKTHLMN